MQKVYYYPPASRLGYENPYSINFKSALSKTYRVCDADNRPAKMLTLSLLCYSFLADVFIINWLESAPFLKMGRLQYCLACLALSIIKLRKKKIVWILHNIHPHNGSNSKSLHIQKRLFAESGLVVAHSKEAYLYAQKNASGKSLFFNHPVKRIERTKISPTDKVIDVLIWGSILPYKGVYEFLSNPEIQNSNLVVRVVGSCKDEKLKNQIQSCCSDKIHFENRRASFEELNSLIQSSRYVLFPYIGDCVSSSGALIDTLVLGGTPLGPKVGAFADLAELGVCLTYNSFFDLMRVLRTDQTIPEKMRNEFIDQSSWENFVDRMVSNI